MQIRAIVAAGLAGLALAACGQGAGVALEPPPQECVDSWNNSAPSLIFGEHVYQQHQSLRAQVYLAEVGKSTPNIKTETTCAAIFAVNISDTEYGDIGLVETKLGWASMTEIDRANPERLEAMQAEADRAANTTLFEDGRLEDSNG